MNEVLQQKIRVSYGTAIVLGLLQARQDIAPTTAYLLWDEGCIGSCSFCPRAGGNTRTRKLSRIVWPEFTFNEVLERLCIEPRPFARVCLQTGYNPQLEGRVADIAEILIKRGLTTSITLSPSQTELARRLLESGADHIGVGLDGASEISYRLHKKKDWQTDWPSLQALLKEFPQKIEVHLIYGLGDSEQVFCQTVAAIIAAKGLISLFALTPVNGGNPPDLAEYRRVQIFRFLCETKGFTGEDFEFGEGRLQKIKRPRHELIEILSPGDCFRTSGCGDCNRPYYNERPGQLFFNFPRPLSQQEFLEELDRSQLSSCD